MPDQNRKLTVSVSVDTRANLHPSMGQAERQVAHLAGQLARLPTAQIKVNTAQATAALNALQTQISRGTKVPTTARGSGGTSGTGGTGSSSGGPSGGPGGAMPVFVVNWPAGLTQSPGAAAAAGAPASAVAKAPAALFADSLSAAKKAEAAAARERSISPVGSDRHLAAIKEQIRLQKESAKLATMDRFFERSERFGKPAAMFALLDEKLESVRRTAGWTFTALTAGLGGIVRSGAPQSFQLIADSMGMLSRQIAISFVPHLVDAAAWLQKASFWVRDLSSSTKSNIATFLVWTAGISGVVYVGAKLISTAAFISAQFGRLYGLVTSLGTGMARMGTQTAAATAQMQSLGNAATATTTRLGRVQSVVQSVSAFARAHPGLASGILAAGAYAGGALAGDTTLGHGLTAAGHGLSVYSGLASFGVAAPVAAPVAAVAATGAYLYSDATADRRVRPIEGGRSTAGNARAERTETEIRNYLRELDRVMAGTRSEIAVRDSVREQFVTDYLKRQGITLEQAKLTPESLRVGEGGLVLGEERIRDISRNAGRAVATHGDTDEARERRIRSLESEGRVAEAHQERGSLLTNQRDRILADMGGFQSQQLDIGSLHQTLQAESMRSPMEQQKMIDAMRELTAILKQIDDWNRDKPASSPGEFAASGLAGAMLGATPVAAVP